MSLLYVPEGTPTKQALDSSEQAKSIFALEHGKIVYLPEESLSLHTEEAFLFSPQIKAGKAKNISYSPHAGKIKHTALTGVELNSLTLLLQRYADYASSLIANLFPLYVPHLTRGRTSFRPIEIAGRIPASYKKDDTRVHVDAFPASPTQGQRILRVFCNINPDKRPRVWEVGESFEQVATQFLPKVASYSSFQAQMLKIFKLTHSYRTAYDHYMLGLHDAMKKDVGYQTSVKKKQFDFPAGSTWIVYTDQVSHAALKGQHLLEQTFYLPPQIMLHAAQTPLYVLEKLLGRHLLVS
ncbi:MAG: 3-deoxy-D-manno-oct-2-ulosonic acid (Kdo) hydroxylase [Legionellales bacterium]|nr:3-deoxy-D-manno-oct-2-ulosonic acid (Kdo) hydroxylase [Legionellales bacterium]